MAQIHKMELQTQIRSKPHQIFEVYRSKTYLMPKISPDKLQSIQVLEGDGKSVGSVRIWTYVMGIPVIAKDKIVAIDEENKIITFEVIGGEVAKYFKNFRATLETKGKTLKWILEFEKVSEDVPNPHGHVEFLIAMSREVDAYLIKA